MSYDMSSTCTTVRIPKEDKKVGPDEPLDNRELVKSENLID